MSGTERAIAMTTQFDARSSPLRLALLCLAIGAHLSTAKAQVSSWEGDSLPTDSNWNLVAQDCDPTVWVDQGWYFQDMDSTDCPPPLEVEQEAFRKPLNAWVGYPTFFVDWLVEGGSDQSEIVWGGPTALAVAHSYGVRYTFFVARNLAKLNRDNLLPLVHVPIKPGIAHTHRLELYGAELYVWYIDGQVVDSGEPEGDLLVFNPRITWLGASINLPTVNRFDHIRYGVIPVDASGDFDSDGSVDGSDYPYFVECLCHCGDYSGAHSPLNAPFGPDGPVAGPDCDCPDVDAGPGCRWADMDPPAGTGDGTPGDGDVDCADWFAFVGAWTGADPPPPAPAACELPPTGPAVPALTQWGAAVLTLLFLTALTLSCAARPAPRNTRRRRSN